MPSIPQSLLWVSLVVLWLFVLVPMLISKRDAVRRTSDVALATRVLTSGANARLLKRAGPASGHRSDPDWQPAGDHDDFDDAPAGVAVMTAPPEAAERDHLDVLDVDVVEEDAAALPPAAEAGTESVAEPAAESDAEPDEVFETEDADDDGIDELADEAPTVAFAAQSATAASRRHRYDTSTAAAVSARKYKFRKRVLTVLSTILVVSAMLAFTVTEAAWWLCGTTATVTVLYLAYLRRQTRIEEQVRRRRAHRMARARLGVENTADPDMDIVPARLRQPGTAVLEIDDEDPVFEHLEHTQVARDQDWASTLPRAAGQ